MLKETLNSLPLSELNKILLQTIDEIMAMHKLGESINEIREKHKQLELIKKVIDAKREATQPS